MRMTIRREGTDYFRVSLQFGVRGLCITRGFPLMNQIVGIEECLQRLLYECDGSAAVKTCHGEHCIEPQLPKVEAARHSIRCAPTAY